MKNLSVLIFVLSSLAQGRALIDPALKTFANGQEGRATEKVIILVNNPNENGIPKPNRYNRSAVINYYQQATRQATLPFLTDLQNRRLPGVRVLNVYWINGGILAEVTRQGLENIASHQSVAKIYRNLRKPHDHPLNAKPGRMRGSLEISKAAYDFSSLGVTRLFQEKPQLNGQGSVVGVVDTGVDGTHPALQGKIVAFFNGQTGGQTEPRDFESHGTHVSGTIAAGDRQNNWIGMAPGAKLAVAGVTMQEFDKWIEGMQWFLDLQKNSPVASRIHVVSSSWQTTGAPDQEVFYRAIAAWEAAGILPVFSAGNCGPSSVDCPNKGIMPPHEYPGTFAVAAYGPDGRVASFSSRGPGLYKGQQTQKPEIAAPGIDINSTVPGGGYAQMSGTSQAAPHVTGAVALLLQVNPSLNPAQLRDILLRSVSLPPGMTLGQWNPEYGFGRLNIYNAVQATLQRTNQLRMSAFGSMRLMTTPGDIDLQEFTSLELGEVDGPVDQWPGTDEARWLTFDEVYGNR